MITLRQRGSLPLGLGCAFVYGVRPKLIEVALPLAAINAAGSQEKSIVYGHPAALHQWWSRKPLAATRAVIWASLVDDPSGDDSLTPEEQEKERQRLFGILERLVVWGNSNNPDVLAEARAEIDRCFPDGPPPILDPFAGGGAIPLEAQRLGLTALAGDLNPVAVLINKAMIEIPPRFAGLAPVHPSIEKTLTTWDRAQGLAADVEAYGQWMRDEAERRIGHLYPDATGPDGEKLTPIAWIWARTVESPDPSWSGHVPLVASWLLANRPGKPKVWVEPTIDRETQTITYEIRQGGEPTIERTVNRGNGTCVATGSAIPNAYIKGEAGAGRMGQQLMAVVAEGDPGRFYCVSRVSDEVETSSVSLDWKPTESLPDIALGFRVQPYGMDEWWKLFTSRQLVALTTFSDLVGEASALVYADALAAGLVDDGVRLRDGGRGATAYADAVVTYLAFVIDKCADYWSTICTWQPGGEKVGHTFGMHALPMAWGFAESNPFSNSSGRVLNFLRTVRLALEALPTVARAYDGARGEAKQRDARARVRESSCSAISTDPPYYDNIPYADISDFFYVWLRKNLADVWTEELSTLATPKADELIADKVRAGSKEQAEARFESGMAEFMAQVARSHPEDVPATIYYAYKATETKDGEVRATGWDTFLQAVLDAGLQVTATWPMRTERGTRQRSLGSNALASSIVLVCRPRAVSAALATRAEFMGALRSELPGAVQLLQSGNIAPVDMVQSTIGPGIKVFSRYARVVEADGSSMSVSVALRIINYVLGEILDGEEAELDTDTRFALSWFAQHGYNPGPSGDADSVARAKNTSLGGIRDSGIGEARQGEFRLFERGELAEDWSPMDDPRLTVWEALQYLVAALERSESEAAELLHTLGGNADRARQLAYVVYQKANDKGWTTEAGAYNALITAWPHLQTLTSSQQTLL